MADRWRIRHENENRLGADQLAALAAVVEFGSFDAVAERLHVTSSAISQRIKALEQRVGQALLIHDKPCNATAAGVPLGRLAAQTAMLETEALDAICRRSDAERLRVAIAVNADSMATWFRFRAVFSRLDVVLSTYELKDQDHSARLLRDGTA